MESSVPWPIINMSSKCHDSFRKFMKSFMIFEVTLVTIKQTDARYLGRANFTAL